MGVGRVELAWLPFLGRYYETTHFDLNGSSFNPRHAGFCGHNRKYAHAQNRKSHDERKRVLGLN